MSGYPKQLLNYSSRLFFNRTRTPGLKHLTLSLTDRCNSRCRTCDIWRKKPRTDMPIQAIEQILSDRLSGDLESVSLTGGEPFLRRDLPEIFSIIRGRLPGRRISISTNGLLGKEILDFLEGAGTKKLTLYISVDGIEKHDYVRGVKGAFEKTIDTIRKIRNRHPGLKLETKFTITPWNHTEILDVYRLSRELGTGFQAKIIENIKSYTNAIDYEKNRRRFSFTEEQKRIISGQLRSLNRLLLKEKKFTDALFVRLMIQYLNKEDFRFKHCNCAFSSLFIMPNGDAYLCRNMDPIGNAHSSGPSMLWKSEKAEHIRNLVRAGKCPPCISLYGFYN
jgi:MoaA/NifB/PqqE/SkfB family radical SAM enzyme